MFSNLRLGIFVKVLGLDRWVRGRFTPMGRVLLGSLVAVGLFALNPRISQAWLLAVVLLTLILIALGQAPWFRPKFRLRRQLPAYATVGRDLNYTVLIENCSRRVLPVCQIREQPARLRTRELRGSNAESGDWDVLHSALSYPQFVRSMRLRDGFRARRGNTVELAPGHQASLNLRLAPLRRGYVNLYRLCLERVDPLGIFRAWQQQRITDRLLVLPRRYRLRWRDRSGRNQRPGSGRAQSSSTGGSVDFARLREYRQGDPMRHIHWRAWAHLGTPVVMEFHQQTPGRSALIMDTFAVAPGDREAFEEAVSVAASFCGDSHWCDGRLELLLLGEQPVRLGYGPQSGDQSSGMDAMLEALACVQPAREYTPEMLVQAARRELEGIEQCICVFLDYGSAHQKLLRDLQLNGISTLVLVVHTDAHKRIRQTGPMATAPRQLLAVKPGEAAQVLGDLPVTRQHSKLAYSA